MAVYYPSIVVNLRIRFDEALQVADMPQPERQDGSSSELFGTGTDTTVDATAARVERQNLITRTGEDNLTHILNRVPKTASVESGSFRQAGKFSLTFDFRELPIDPRVIRAARIEIFQGAVDEGDFATGMTKLEANGTRRSVLNITNPDGQINEDLLVLTGLVDSWQVSHDQKGSRVSLTGRDLRGLFLDSPVNPIILAKLNYALPIDKVVEQLLETHPASKTNNLYIQPLDRFEWPNETIPIPNDNEIRARQSARGNKPQNGVSTGKANYWDIITNLCFRVGALPYLQNQTLIIRPSRNIFEKIDTDADPDESPFLGGPLGTRGPRIDSNGNAFNVRKMIYGRNIEAVNYERKYTGVTVPVIEAISTDHSKNVRGKQKLLKVQWPSNEELAAMTTSVSPDGLVGQIETVKIPVAGVRDKARLLDIAKSLYEEIGRGELGGSCRTKSLASVHGGNSDPDILRLRAGDAVEFSVDTRRLARDLPAVSEIIDVSRRSFEEQVAAVRESWTGKGQAVDENLIRVLVASSRSNIIDVLRYFRIHNIRWNWSGGVVSIAFDFHNYFIARYDVTEKLGKPTKKKRKRLRKETDRKKKQAAPKGRWVTVGGQRRLLLNSKKRRVPIAAGGGADDGPIQVGRPGETLDLREFGRGGTVQVGEPGDSLDLSQFNFGK